MQAEGEVVQLPRAESGAPDFREFFEGEHRQLFKTLYFVTGSRADAADLMVGSSRVDLQACKLEYSIVSPK